MNSNYVNYLKSEKKSDKTIRSYTNNVNECLEFLGKNDVDITYEDLIKYKGYISEQSPATIALKVNSIKNYFKYLKSIKAISENPAIELTVPKVKNKVKPYMTAEDVRALINNAYSARNKAIIALVASTGLREEEMANITIDQWNKMMEYNTRNIVIKGKGDKERAIYINDMAMSYIAYYLKVRNTNDSGYLFESYRGNKLSDNGLNIMLKVAAKKAGLPYWEDMTMHVLRHAFATVATHNGVPISVISEALGHSSLSTTTRYVHTSQYDIDNAMAGMNF